MTRRPDDGSVSNRGSIRARDGRTAIFCQESCRRCRAGGFGPPARTPMNDGIFIRLSRLASQWPAGLSFRPSRSYLQAMSTDPRNPNLKVLFVRAPQDLVAWLDRWRGTQADVPNRSDAIRRILDERLRAD